LRERSEASAVYRGRWHAGTPGHGSLPVVPNPLKQPPSATGQPRPGHVPQRSLAELAEAVPEALVTGTRDAHAVLISGFTHDSRAVLHGDLYAAMAGATVHGAEFSAQAAERGAAAILTDRDGAERAAATGLPEVVCPLGRPGPGPRYASLT